MKKEEGEEERKKEEDVEEEERKTQTGILLSPPKTIALNQTQPKIIIYNKRIKLKL